jgi:hypothetical protein
MMGRDLEGKDIARFLLQTPPDMLFFRCITGVDGVRLR